MLSIAIVLSACVLCCALALPTPAAEGPTFEPNEIKFDGSTDGLRIIGGSSASDGQFPYMVSLRRTNIHFCGAAIVSARYLLSAAHCSLGISASSVTAVVGTVTLNSGGTGYVLESILDHPNFNLDTTENDISLLRTANSIIGSSVVASIPISSASVGAGVATTLTGWGRTDPNSADTPNNLQFINLNTIDNAECAQTLSPIFPSSLCTLIEAGQGPCHGDSGGPLVASGVLVGITSWGGACAAGYPDVFARVSSYVAWIQENAT